MKASVIIPTYNRLLLRLIVSEAGRIARRVVWIRETAAPLPGFSYEQAQELGGGLLLCHLRKKAVQHENPELYSR
ncbi:hypothetical protein DUZ99_14380 [Xylanibacillus composti]|uniref:Uncharacterized protein n=1 Tax=Xylanibacillus composti TaxID=1572762 RepID=A0A8J4H6C0_9BACL|nr:hypothetical protein [Xylanibacillus composti]MDT9726164.1 hypothetical protein [Xylanibacillus composti]GIQ70601.1 hypothetical protein XYCOK13_34250 [Xylanibacillus composti]